MSGRVEVSIVEALLFRTNDEATLAPWAALRGALPGVPAGASSPAI